MDECVESFGDATSSSTLDANSGYFKVEVGDEKREKTASTSHHGAFCFIRKPLSQKNAHAMFLHVMYIIPALVKWQFALIYCEDIVILFKYPDEH